MVSHADFSKSLDFLFLIIQFDLFNDCHPRYVTLKSRARMINVKCRRHEQQPLVMRGATLFITTPYYNHNNNVLRWFVLSL